MKCRDGDNPPSRTGRDGSLSPSAGAPSRCGWMPLLIHTDFNFRNSRRVYGIKYIGIE
jgi:hypothetical protein